MTRKKRGKVVLDSPAAIERHLRRNIEPEGFASFGIRLVFCDHRNRVFWHCHVGEVPRDLGSLACAQTISTLTHSFLPDAMLVALTRPGPPMLTAADGRWFRAAHEVCAVHEVRLLGVHIVTPRGQREVLLDDAL
jgi:hypothetical protein